MPSELCEPHHRSRLSAGSLRQTNLLRGLRAAGSLEHRQGPDVSTPINPRSTKKNLILGWAIAFLTVALIAGALGFGILSGTAFATKIVFLLALLAFLISAVVEVARRGAP